MRIAVIALLSAFVATADATPSVAFGPLGQPAPSGQLVTQTTFIDRDDFRRSYRDQLYALRSRETGACGFGREWYAFPGTQRYGFFESPGPCRYRMYRKRYRSLIR